MKKLVKLVGKSVVHPGVKDLKLYDTVESSERFGDKRF